MDIPRRRASAMRQLALKVLIGFVALISGSYDPKRAGVLVLWLQMQGVAVTVYRPVLSIQAQRLVGRYIWPTLTGPLRN
jgi:hypothetical protein